MFFFLMECFASNVKFDACKLNVKLAEVRAPWNLACRGWCASFVVVVGVRVVQT